MVSLPAGRQATSEYNRSASWRALIRLSAQSLTHPYPACLPAGRPKRGMTVLQFKVIEFIMVMV